MLWFLKKNSRKKQVDDLLDKTREVAMKNNWTKSMVLLLDDSDDLYNIICMHPDFKYSELLGLLEVVKTGILDACLTQKQEN